LQRYYGIVILGKRKDVYKH